MHDGQRRQGWRGAGAPGRLSGYAFGCLLAASLTGCGNWGKGSLVSRLPFLYRIDVQQGSVIEPETLYRLEAGMTKEQARDVLGTPSLVDPFHGDRWYYIYTIRRGGEERMQRTFVLRFRDDRLAMISGDVVAGTGPPPDLDVAEKAVRVPDKPPPGLFGRLFKSDRPSRSPRPTTPDSRPGEGADVIGESEEAK